MSSIGGIGSVLVIGAGPSGAAAAIRLHDLGIPVLLVDRCDFPRPKLCGGCLNLAALAALRTIGCDRLIAELAPAPLRRWQLRTADRIIEAPLPGGVALSRTRMDAALVDEAIRRGIPVRTSCRATLLDVAPDAVWVRLADDPSPRRFEAVILATGLSGGGVARWLPWAQQPTGPIGAGAIISHSDAVAAGTIQIASDPAGYVGMVRLEDGRIDLAAALRSPVGSSGPTRSDPRADPAPQRARAALVAAIEGILQRTGASCLPAIDPASLLTTPPLRRTRRVGHGRLLAVGDAAGYVEPFTGEGMAWAISTGIAAAQCLADTADRADCGALWAARYGAMMRRRQWICRMLSHTLASPRRTSWLMQAMTAAPWTVRYAIRRLNAANRH